MFNFSGIREQVSDYTQGTDIYVSEVVNRLYDLNPDAQSVDDFGYDVFADVLIACEE